VRDLKIIEGSSGPFVAMPSRKLTAHCPQCGCKNHLRASFCNQCGARLKEQAATRDEEGRAKLYADIAHPINSACREMIQQRVIHAFEQEKERASEPGYISSYDDFDYDEQPAAKSRESSRPVEPAQLQAAEKPRGPHKAPAEQPQSHRPHNDSFGAGVFD
jgi:stage V sporulation protein G